MSLIYENELMAHLLDALPSLTGYTFYGITNSRRLAERVPTLSFTHHRFNPLELARRLVEVAAECGAHAVKFQTFKADRVVSATAPKAEYQLQTTDATESQLEMLQRLELSPEAHRELQSYCQEQEWLLEGVENETLTNFNTLWCVCHSTDWQRILTPSLCR